MAQRVVVTGASRGIGAAIALATGKGAAQKWCCQREVGMIWSRWHSRCAETGGTAHIVLCDVTDTGDVTRLYQESMAAMGGIDVLVNNAGIAATAIN